MFLAWLPVARYLAQVKRDLVATQDTGKQAAGHGYELSACSAGLDRHSGMGSREGSCRRNQGPGSSKRRATAIVLRHCQFEALVAEWADDDPHLGGGDVRLQTEQERSASTERDALLSAT